jgi:hypothetical protein
MGLRLEGRERRGEGSGQCGGRRDLGWRGSAEEQRVGRRGSELDRDLAKRERRRVRMSTKTRRLTGVGRGIILPPVSASGVAPRRKMSTRGGRDHKRMPRAGPRASAEVAAGGRGREEEAGGADLRRRQRWERRAEERRLCEVGFQQVGFYPRWD